MFQELPFPVSASDQPSGDEASDSGIDSTMLSERSYSAGAASLPISAKCTNECALSLIQSEHPADSLRKAHSLPVIAMATSSLASPQVVMESVSLHFTSEENDDGSIVDFCDERPYPGDDSAGNICLVCFSNAGTVHLDCCGCMICQECIAELLIAKINDGIVNHIPCPSSFCREELSEDTIHTALQFRPGMLEKYERFRIAQSEDSTKKPCPRCSKVMVHHISQRRGGRLTEKDVKVTCSVCMLEWCFSCHAPWHAGLACKELKNGNKLFHKWIKSRSGPKGQKTANGQYCPGCRIPIQRTVGCNSMQCTHCRTNFCYQCGETFKTSLLFGNHYKTLTPNGCKGKYKGSTAERNFVVYSYIGVKCTIGLAYPALYIPVIGVAAVGVLAYLGYKHGREAYRKRQLNRRRLPQRH